MAKATSERVKHTYEQWCLMGKLKPVGDPWVNGQNTEYVADIGIEGESTYVCYFQSYTGGNDAKSFPLPTKRRAELACAAPDLYRSLNDLLDIIHDDLTHEQQAAHSELIERARQAIDKAEGILPTPASKSGGEA